MQNEKNIIKCSCGKILNKNNKSGLCKECKDKISLQKKIEKTKYRDFCECGRSRTFPHKKTANGYRNGKPTLCPYCKLKNEFPLHRAIFILIFDYVVNIDFINKSQYIIKMNNYIEQTLMGYNEMSMNTILYRTQNAYYFLDIPEINNFQKVFKKNELTDEHINGRSLVSIKLFEYMKNEHSYLFLNTDFKNITDEILIKFSYLYIDFLLRYCVSIKTTKNFNQRIKELQNRKDENNNKIPIEYYEYIREINYMLESNGFDHLCKDSEDILKYHMFK